MNLKAFFVATLSSALDLGIATADDVIRHVTPDVLSIHLPRPLWARLLTACVGAPHVDAQLVVETIGVPNLCEHIPAQIIWGCIEELAQRSLAGGATAGVTSTAARPQAAPTASGSRPIPLATPPPPPVTEPKAAAPAAPAAVGPSIPVPGAPVAPAVESEPDTAGRPRAMPGQRFRQSNTGISRPSATSARRPQAQATPPASPPAGEPASDRGNAAARAKRGQTEADFDLETFVGGKEDWKSALAVEDEQLVEWSASEETVTGGDEYGRKR